jgi:hypothetical protein
MDIEINWFDKQKPGWYEYKIIRDDVSVHDWVSKYYTVVSWILENIEMPYRHVRWTLYDEYAVYCFRYERNYLVFLLRWS